MRVSKKDQNRFKRVLAARNKNIVAMYKKGMSVKKIIRCTRLSQTAIYKILRDQFGKRHSQNRMSDISKFSKTHSVKETAEKFGCSEAFVYVARFKRK